MGKAVKEVLNFFKNRRSVSVNFISEPGPNKDQLTEILKMGVRCPDHGRLEPWRILVISEENAKMKIVSAMDKIGRKRDMDTDKLEKSKSRFLKSPVILAVIASPKEGRIPIEEQILSAGALCMCILNAALANGWGANWLTGWMANDKELGRLAFNTSKNEFVAGYLYVGSFDESSTDRPRPQLEKKISYFQID